MKSGIEMLNSLRLLKFDAIFYRSMCLALLESNQQMPRHALAGNEIGYAPFMFSSLCRDMSITAYEGIRFLQLESSIDSDAYIGFFDDLKNFRNNMHPYNPRSSYKPKADSIIKKQSEFYKMDNNDPNFALRSDISLVCEIINSYILIGGDYLIYHLTDAHKSTWAGEHYRDFSQHVSSIVNTLSLIDSIDADYNIGKVFIPMPIQIELFDYKSCNLLSASPLTTDSVIFRILVLLSQVEFANVIIRNNVDGSGLLESLEWMTFLTKWLAMYYDEAIDSIENLLKHCNDIDKYYIEKAFMFVIQNNANIRKKARDLRNMCHYSIDTQAQSISKAIPTNNSIVKIILSSVGITTWLDLKNLYLNLCQAVSDIANSARQLLPVQL